MKKLEKVLSVMLFAAVAVSAVAASSNKSTHRIESATFVMEQDTDWEPAGDGVVRQILGYDERMMMVKVKFEQGAIGTAHRHPHTQTTYVVSGKFKFTVGDESKIVGPGDGIYMAPDVLHGCVCLESGVLIDCFAPMRDDFLK